jgi:hypothetical protein
MKRTIKHAKEKTNPVQQPAFKTPEEEIGALLASCGLFNPLTIALATNKVRPVPRRGRPREMEDRDEQIVRMKDAQKWSFGKIAQKLKIGREVAESAYYRMKRNPPPR